MRGRGCDPGDGYGSGVEDAKIVVEVLLFVVRLQMQLRSQAMYDWKQPSMVKSRAC